MAKLRGHPLVAGTLPQGTGMRGEKWMEKKRKEARPITTLTGETKKLRGKKRGNLKDEERKLQRASLSNMDWDYYELEQSLLVLKEVAQKENKGIDHVYLGQTDHAAHKNPKTITYPPLYVEDFGERGR